MPFRTTAFEVGEYYHVYNRGCNREPIFATSDNYLYFLTRMRDYLAPGPAEVIAYCLMPNHYHLLVRLTSGDFSAAMHKLSVSYAKAFNKQRGRVGPLFQGPFRAIHVDKDEYLLELSRYIHLNPVAAGLITRPEDWAYSSYPEYIGVRSGTLPTPGVVLERIGSADRYRAFVEESGREVSAAIGHLLGDEE
jgi:REP element-mobilizing transposase RayT